MEYYLTKMEQALATDPGFPFCVEAELEDPTYSDVPAGFSPF
jgi:hypothetical protein